MARDDSDEKDKDDPTVEGAGLKKLIKKAKTRDIMFAFLPPAGQMEAQLALNLRKAPKKLSQMLRTAVKKGIAGGPDDEDEDEDDGKKKGKNPTKFTYGTLRDDGKVLTMNVERDIPGLKKKMEKMLRAEKIKREVKISTSGDSGGGADVA
jgi:hypothetical protein